MGKGSGRRPPAISREEEDAAWQRIFWRQAKSVLPSMTDDGAPVDTSAHPSEIEGTQAAIARGTTP